MFILLRGSFSVFVWILSILGSLLFLVVYFYFIGYEWLDNEFVLYGVECFFFIIFIYSFFILFFGDMLIDKEWI